MPQPCSSCICLITGVVLLGSVACPACSYDFDGAFAEEPIFASSDGGTDTSETDSSEVDGDASDGRDGAPGVDDGCWPSCVGKCEGADNGCGNTCTTDDCDGVCCSEQCCDVGLVCDEEQACCSPATCHSAGVECGNHEDGCGGTVSCGDCEEGPCSAEGQCTGCPYGACGGSCCGAGQVCTPNGACCTPTTCDELGVACGMHDDGCGNPMSCGTCSQDAYCLNGQFCAMVTFRFEQVSQGTFTMGSPTGEPGRNEYAGEGGDLDETAHTVTLSRDFEISDSEVTQGDFEAVMGYNPSHFSSCGEDCPVEYLTWDEAASFCNELSELKQLEPCFDCSGTGASTSCSLASGIDSPYDCVGYRLPTEAEWEYGARGGTQSAFFSGSLMKQQCDELDPNLNTIGWYIANGEVSYSGSLSAECEGAAIAIGTHPVKGRVNNSFGLHDMAGNVWEWVFDCSGSYPTGSQINPMGPPTCNQGDRIYRGGGAGNLALFCRHAERADYTPSTNKNIDIGFRPARTLF